MKPTPRAALIYAAVTCLLLWPLLRAFGSGYAHDAGDSVLNTWILWWSTRALPLTQAWWDGPMFFPARDVIALSEVLLSLLPVSGVVQAVTGNPVAAFNAVYVLSFWASGFSVYLLARELTGRDDAAIVGGLAWMLAPYRAEQLSHVQVLSYYWAPVVLFSLHRYLTDSRPRWLALFGGAWLLQVLANGYALFELSVLIALWTLWFARPFRRGLPIMAAGALASLPLLPILLKYRVVHDRLHLLRDINEIKDFGVDLADFVAAPDSLLVWGGRLGPTRPETAAFPGLTVIVLAVVGAYVLWRHAVRVHSVVRWPRVLVFLACAPLLVALSVVVAGPWAVGPLTVGEFRKPFSIAVMLCVVAFLGSGWTRRMWRERSVPAFYVLAAVAMYVLAMGPEPRLLGRPFLYEPPYAWLMHLPGFDVMRVPARFLMLAALCQAVLIAWAVRTWAHGPRRVAIVTAVTVGLVVDGWVSLPVAAAPANGISHWEHVAAVVELPIGETNTDFGALYRSMTHGVPTVNGVSGYLPPHILPLTQALRDRQFSALFELSSFGPIGVAYDRSQTGAEDLTRVFQTMGFAPGPSTGTWDRFIVPSRPRAAVALGDVIPIAGVKTSAHQEHAARMLDRDLFTAWGTEAPQAGGEEVTVDLGAVRDVGAVVLEMAAYSFGYSKALEIDVSDDGLEWLSVWGGAVGALAVRAAIDQPERVPITFDLARVRGRYIRLRQVEMQPTLPWWIAEIRVHAPVAERP
ncbi:MAG: discoidin domain-containing protein [Acidobacteria bacterium]|nr:discoidin domain-containing protein [Acidobacteriota bacterium]